MQSRQWRQLVLLSGAALCGGCEKLAWAGPAAPAASGRPRSISRSFLTLRARQVHLALHQCCVLPWSLSEFYNKSLPVNTVKNQLLWGTLWGLRFSVQTFPPKEQGDLQEGEGPELLLLKSIYFLCSHFLPGALCPSRRTVDSSSAVSMPPYPICPLCQVCRTMCGAPGSHHDLGGGGTEPPERLSLGGRLASLRA